MLIFAKLFFFFFDNPLDIILFDFEQSFFFSIAPAIINTMSYNPNGYQNFQPVQDDYQLKYKAKLDYQYQQLYQQQQQQQQIQQQISQQIPQQLQQQHLAPQVQSIQPVQQFQQQPTQQVSQQMPQQAVYASAQSDPNALLKTIRSKDDLQRLFSVCIFNYFKFFFLVLTFG